MSLGAAADDSDADDSHSVGDMEDVSKYCEDLVSLPKRISCLRNWLHFYQYFLQNVDPEDEKALAMFMNPNPAPRRTLADIIMEKITEKQTEVQSQFTEADGIELLIHFEVLITCFQQISIRNKLKIY